MPTWSYVHAAGHLGKDAEVKTLPSGQTITEFTMAVTVSKKTPAGAWEKFPNWYRVSCWKNLPEWVTRALVKGAAVYVCGVFQANVWKTQEGQERTSLDIRADLVCPLSGDKGKDEADQRGQQAAPYDAPVNDDSCPF